ncbi:MAG: dihydrolipoamide acetyltransferase [Rhodobacteraceae bacterium]|nr:dihydrolipoamide acetyltransferase [Paracoccaceae bacterium]
MADIIMPALGMAQDTGKLVKWLKAPGDPVTTGDPLFEVETDKSVMEVEAQADGFLTRVSASDGDDVPVGQVIAVIGDTADNAVAPAQTTPDPASDPAPEPLPTPAPEPDVKAAPAPGRSAAVAAPAGGHILASPKARRLASEEGLDLADLGDHGVLMPYHVGDLEVLRRAATSPGQPVVMAATKQITARCPKHGVHKFIDWMQTDGDITVRAQAIFTSFAAAALRAATERNEIVIQQADSDGRTVRRRNPDVTRLSAPAHKTDDTADLELHDLTDGFLTSLRIGDANLPTLGIGADGDSYLITFEFNGAHLHDDQAIAFVTGFARRLADPLYHLV